MTLTAIRIPTGETISISDIATINDNENEDKKIYYISGGHDIRSSTQKPLNVSFDGIDMLKTYNIELDTKLYRNIRLSGIADVNN